MRHFDCYRLILRSTLLILSVKYCAHSLDSAETSTDAYSASHTANILIPFMPSLWKADRSFLKQVVLVFCRLISRIPMNFNCGWCKKAPRQISVCTEWPTTRFYLHGHPVTSNQRIPLWWVSDPVWLIVVLLCTPCSELSSAMTERTHRWIMHVSINPSCKHNARREWDGKTERGTDGRKARERLQSWSRWALHIKLNVKMTQSHIKCPTIMQ